MRVFPIGSYVFTGHTFRELKAEINADTRAAIRNFERPRNKKGIQAFLGLINWDRRFIKNLSKRTQPLEELLKKGSRFEWKEEQQKAFDGIKRDFDEATELFLIRPEYKFGIATDAAYDGLGTRLYQYREDDPARYTVGFASRSLKGAEHNYTVTELECTSVGLS